MALAFLMNMARHTQSAQNRKFVIIFAIYLEKCRNCFFFFWKKKKKKGGGGGFTPCKAEQPLRGMELQEKESQKG